MEARKRKIGVLTSGGDAPGMNAAIRAVVRTALARNFEVIGIRKGFEGLLSTEIIQMNAKSVSDIIHRGGTILLTARSERMYTTDGKDKAAHICKVLGLDALIVIGGDGSFRGAQELSKRGVNVIGIPATIDLDMPFTEYTIGFDTAVNTGMDAVNKIRDTSGSHERCSVVEVMGRNAGFISLWCGIAGGAEEVLIPERAGDSGAEGAEARTNAVIRQIIENRSKGKTHNLIIVAEGVGGSFTLAKEIQNVTGIESRATILGYLQRGGSPTATDRMHASMMGFMAIEALCNNAENQAVVFKEGRHMFMDLDTALAQEKKYNDRMYDIIKILAV